MAIMARIGSIIMLISAIAVVAATVMGKDLQKGGAIAKLIFAVIAFVGQFLINSYTSMSRLLVVGFSNKGASAGIAAFIGFVMIALSGLVLLIMGIAGRASKNKTGYNNNMMNQYGSTMGQNGMMGQQYNNNNNNNNNMMGQ